MGGSGISWTICKSFAPHFRQITTSVPHYSIFYGPDALPDAQPTVSKHWRNNILELSMGLVVNCIESPTDLHLVSVRQWLCCWRLLAAAVWRWCAKYSRAVNMTCRDVTLTVQRCCTSLNSYSRHVRICFRPCPTLQSTCIAWLATHRQTITTLSLNRPDTAVVFLTTGVIYLHSMLMSNVSWAINSANG